MSQINMPDKDLLKITFFLRFTSKDAYHFSLPLQFLFVHKQKIDYDCNSDWAADSCTLFWNILAREIGFCFQYESLFYLKADFWNIACITILNTETWDYFSRHFCSSKRFFYLFLFNTLKQQVVILKLLSRFH